MRQVGLQEVRKTDLHGKIKIMRKKPTLIMKVEYRHRVFTELQLLK